MSSAVGPRPPGSDDRAGALQRLGDRTFDRASVVAHCRATNDLEA
jgi:hypothetical protein